MIKIKTDEKYITVESPYNSEFITKARNLAGKWVSPSWVFDIRNENDVRNACLEYYGSDGLGNADVVDVQVVIRDDLYCTGSPITLFCRVLAEAFGRDSGAKLGDGIVLKEGGFDSGGSAKNWCTSANENTVLIMRDVSRKLVEQHDDETFKVDIIQAKPEEYRIRLQNEKKHLLLRLDEIEKLLE